MLNVLQTEQYYCYSKTLLMVINVLTCHIQNELNVFVIKKYFVISYKLVSTGLYK